MLSSEAYYRAWFYHLICLVLKGEKPVANDARIEAAELRRVVFLFLFCSWRVRVNYQLLLQDPNA